MRKLAKNQRIKYNDRLTIYGFRPSLILQERCCFTIWFDVVSIDFPEDFNYECSEEIKNKLLSALWNKYDAEMMARKRNQQSETKEKQFKKCIKKFIKNENNKK